MTGPIPPELGKLQNLKVLALNANRWVDSRGLTGSIPSELGNLQTLDTLKLDANRLTGPIPPELGNLRTLKGLSLGSNLLTDGVPPELGNLRILEFLSLDMNRELRGRLPLELIGVPLKVFWWDGTDLCAPADEEFLEWLASIRNQRGRQC